MSKHFPTILNRQFQHPTDGWYHIEPKGEHTNVSAKVVQVIDDKASQGIVDAFNDDADKYKAKHGVDFPGMLINREHFSHDDDKETAADGWLMSLQNRADGIYGQINWTGKGKSAVDGHEYRFFSSEYDPAQLEIPNRVGDMTRARPTRLSGLTLTNRPNNKGGRPITNTLPHHAENSPTGEQVDKQRKQKTTMKLIANRLGLSTDAAEEVLVGEIDKLKNRATTAETQIGTLTTERDLLKNRVTELQDEQIAADLEAHGIKDEAVLNKLKPVLGTMKNRTERLDFLKLLKTEKKETPATITNRATAKTPEGSVAADGGDETAKVKRANTIANRASELMKNDSKLSLGAAYQRAEMQVDRETAAK